MLRVVSVLDGFAVVAVLAVLAVVAVLAVLDTLSVLTPSSEKGTASRRSPRRMERRFVESSFVQA